MSENLCEREGRKEGNEITKKKKNPFPKMVCYSEWKKGIKSTLALGLARHTGQPVYS